MINPDSVPSNAAIVPNARAYDCRKSADVNALYKALAASFVRRVSYRLFNDAIAQDIVHDAFVKVLTMEQPPQFPTVKDAEFWFGAAIKNRCIDYIRKASTRHEGHATTHEDHQSATPINDFAGSEAAQLLTRLAAVCTPRQLDIAFRRCAYGESQEEIAVALNINRKTVYRDLEEMRTKLKGLEGIAS